MENKKNNTIDGIKVFLFDSIGAFVAILLLLVLYFFEDFFGLPKNIAIMLITIALTCFIYSTSVYLIKPNKWKTFLMILAGMNFCYFLFTAFQVSNCFPKLTVYGRLYFIGDVFIILTLTIFEFNKSRETTNA
jgi:hypothetical protein